MYFVRYGEICVRYVGTEGWSGDDLPEFVDCYDYDDESRWTVAGLKKELKRVSSGMDLDMNAMKAADMELARRRGEPVPESIDDFDELISLLGNDDELDDDWDEDEDWNDRSPLITPDEVSLLTRKLIRDVANAERAETQFTKSNFENKDPITGYKEIDDETSQKFVDLYQKGFKAREALMNSDIGQMVSDMIDPVEDMKAMAAQMLFLYAQDRMKAETTGGKPEEDFFYAGAHLYAHAAIDQLSEDDDDDDEFDDDYFDDDDFDDDEFVFPQNLNMDEFTEYVRKMNEHMKKASMDDEFMLAMDEVTEREMADKGFNINTLSGCKAAQAWLEKARVEDAFATEGPIDNPVDWFVGEGRLDAMLRCVRARISKMIGK